MHIVPLPLLDDPAVRLGLVEDLKAGKIAVYPTDTLYGVGGRGDLPAVCLALDRLKKRPAGQVYSVALGSMEMLKALAWIEDDRLWTLLTRVLPGPYTFVIRLLPAVRLPASGYGPTLGIRIPDLPPLTRLITELNAPLITTSINRSGEPPMHESARIREAFPSLDLLIDAGDLPQTAPSTLLDMSTPEPFALLRRGGGFEALVACLDELGLGWRPGPA
jgi:L-threonylcarbamoyladenylate synthase